MKISYNWLKDFVTLPKNVTAKEIQERLTLSAVEVEGVEDLSEKLRGIIVAEIKSVTKHPNADKLNVAMVFDGKRELQIVCGAPNIAAGQKVPLAQLGTFLPAMGVTIEKRPVRGVESNGMLCAPDELGLGSDHAGILILDSKSEVGKPLAEVLGLNDVIFEIDNKSMTHRPDMWSHFGIARELAVMYGVKLKDVKPKKIAETKSKLDIKVKDQVACPRYMAVKIDGVSGKESPDWLKNRLNSIGQKPISALVDVTNYVMYELGQPMHAFDADLVGGHQITVRKANDGELVKTLDDQDFRLTKDDLVIANGETPIAIAGVKGLKNSGISEKVKSVIIESANFDHVTIRKTSQRLGLRTDSSARYEKSLDPNLAPVCLARAVELILEIFPEAKVSSAVTDVKKFKLNQGPIKVSLKNIQEKIGSAVPGAQIVKILTSLGFKVKNSNGNLSVTVPTWRATKDIEGAHDLVEEVIRVYGYNNIDSVLPSFQITRPPVDFEKMIIEKSRDIMAYGFDAVECYGYSFIGEQEILNFQEKPENFVRVLNPLAEGLEYVRRELTPGLVTQVSSNEKMFDHFNLFEVGKVFHLDESGPIARPGDKEVLPKQDTHLAVVIHDKGNEASYLTAKNIAEVLLHRLHFKPELVEAQRNLPWLHPHRLRYIRVNGQTVGFVSELERNIAKKLKIKEKIGILEINLTLLASQYSDLRSYAPIPKYPAITLDVSLEVSTTVLWAAVQNVINELNKDLVKDVKLFDVYEGEKVEAGKKSLAFSITYRSDDRTLEMKEADALHTEIKAHLEKRLGAKVR